MIRVMNKRIDPDRIGEIADLYAVDYCTDHIIRWEKGKPIHLWDTAYFERAEHAKAFARSKAFGRGFEYTVH